MNRTLATAIAVGFLLTPAYADIVKLKNGGQIEGIVKEDDDKVILETGYGTVMYDQKDVLTIVKTQSDPKAKSKLEEYYEKLKEIQDSQNPDNWYNLAEWAKENKVPRFVSELLQKALFFDPNHEKAHKMLRHEFYQGKWMTKDEVMKVKGFVQFRGKWVTPEEQQLVLQKEKEAQLKAQAEQEIAQRRAEEERRRENEEEQNQQIERRAYQVLGMLQLPSQDSGFSPFMYNPYMQSLPPYSGYGYGLPGVYNVLPYYTTGSYFSLNLNTSNYTGGFFRIW